MPVVTGTGSVDHPAGGPRDARGPAIPGVGDLGPGFGAILRRQPAPSAQGGAKGGCADLFELICFDCGDNPGLDYALVSPRLQRIRGPRTMGTAWTAYERHLGLAPHGQTFDARGPVNLGRGYGSERGRAHPAPVMHAVGEDKAGG
jgi:hypothetical protein